MKLQLQFRSRLWSERRAAGGDDALRPVWLSRAVRAVLPADEVSLSVADDDRRVPLGSSDESAALAEQMQFTLGSGPCLEAIRHGIVVLAGEQRLQSRWPALAEAWRVAGQFRSAASLPVPILGAAGALNLYFRGARTLADLSSDDGMTVAGLVAEQLSVDGQRWLAGPAARHRQQVWVAAGMTMERFGLGNRDAIAVLRGHAYALSVTLDELADEVIRNPDRLDALRP